jgi:hypothetical protein
MLLVAAARLEQDHANPKLIADLREAAKSETKRRAEGRDWSEEDTKRIERQRTMFAQLPVYAACDRLKAAMQQRVYDLMWDGDTNGADALAEFLPSVDADAVFDAWEADTTAHGDVPRSKWYAGEI